jgi:Flp pilus assembly protein TadG
LHARDRRERDRGQALVEFALVIPIFLLIVLGLFDLGRAVFYHTTLSNASREAVRVGIVDQNANAIRTRALEASGGVMSVSSGDVVISHLNPDLSSGGTCSTAPYDIGCVVKVEMTHEFQPATPFVPTLSLHAETHQSIERKYTSP